MAPSSAHAIGGLTLSFNTPYNGDVPNAGGTPGTPVGSANPALTATFTDVTPGKVELKLQALMPINQYIDGLAFNLNPGIPLSGLTIFSCTAPGAICSNYKTSLPPNGISGTPILNQNSFALQGNGNGTGFDFGFEFVNDNSGAGNKRFNGQELVTLVLQASGLTAQSFDFTNSPTGSGSQYVGYGGAKINGIFPSGSGAVGASKVTINPNPVPGPLPILGVGTALAYSRRLRSRIRSTRHPLDTGIPS